jgi:hypothetical protein
MIAIRSENYAIAMLHPLSGSVGQVKKVNRYSFQISRLICLDYGFSITHFGQKYA